MLFGLTIDERERLGHASNPANGRVYWLGWALAFVVCVLFVGCERAVSDSSSVALTDVTDASFQQEVIEANQPVLVEFWAPWCQPCLEMAPDVERIAEAFSGRAKVVRIRTDENQKTASEYNVDAPPAVILFRNGNIVKRRQGKQSAENLAAILSEAPSDEVAE